MQVFVVFGGSVVLVADLPKLQKSNVLCFLIIGPDFVFCDEEMWSSRSLWHLPDILTRNWYDAEIEIGFYDNSKLWPWSFGIENSKFCSLILVDLTRAKTIAKALDRGLLERNGRKLDMERKVQRSSWFLTNKILSPGFKTTCVRTQENDIHQLNTYSKCDWMTGWHKLSEEKRHFSAGTLTGDQGWQFHSGTFFVFPL